MTKFITSDRETMLLLSPSIEDWLPKKHLARLVVEIVEKLDLSELKKTYTTTTEAYSPSMMVSLLFYGYVTGVQSSRKIETATYESIPFRFITGNLHPDHDTIADFRRRFLPFMDSIFLQILKICVEMNLIKAGRINLKSIADDSKKRINVAHDGTKIKANASKHKALSYEYAQNLEKKLKEEIVQLKALSEKAENEENVNPMNIPDELERRENRLKKIETAIHEIERRAQERFEKEQAEYEAKKAQREQQEKETGKKPKGKGPKPPTPTPQKTDQVNLTDEESRIMPKSGGKEFVQAYNAQATIDMESRIIVAAYVSQATNDKKEIAPTIQNLKKTENETGILINNLAADAGYFSEDNNKQCEEAGYNPLIPQKREETDNWLKNQLENQKNNPDTTTKITLTTNEGKELYAKRKSTIEPAFGVIKEAMNFTRFSMRGLKKIAQEWLLVTTAFNIKRMFKMLTTA